MVMTDRGDAADVTAFRSEIWGHAIALIKAQPWLGVGWGQFNFAWTLTPFADAQRAAWSTTRTTCRCSWPSSWACRSRR